MRRPRVVRLPRGMSGAVCCRCSRGQHSNLSEAMIKLNVRRSACRVAWCAALMSITFEAAAGAVPRAWLVSKGGAQAVLVGESHVGNPTETDSYFHTVVQPSYAVADTAVMEIYWGPEQRGNEAADRGTPCFTDPKDRRTERLRPAFDQLIAATRANRLEVPNWMSNWEILPEFFFTSNFLDAFSTNSLGESYFTARDSQLGLGVSSRLRASGLGPVAKNVVGLESLKDRRTIFCSASAAHRQDFLFDSVLNVTALLRYKQSDPSYAGLHKLAGSLGRSIQETIRCVDRATPCQIEQLSADARLLQASGLMPMFSPGTFEILLKQRTHAWLPLIEKAMMTHRRTFVIVGAMHLPDLSVEGKVEFGLISLLRKQGYSVKSIAGADDIKTDFLSPTWIERARATWSRL